MTISKIFRTYGKQFRQIHTQYSDGSNGRCALGVLMSYFGWDGRDESHASERLVAALDALKQDGIDKSVLIDLNDSGHTFDEIADYLDRTND